MIDTPPHPSSGFRETPDATFPPRGEGISLLQSLRPFGGEGVERSETDEGAFQQADGWINESVIDTPPHPSSGFRETPDATFPPRGEGFALLQSLRPFGGEGVERSETDEGAFRQADR